jgi:hypothetical protein
MLEVLRFFSKFPTYLRVDGENVAREFPFKNSVICNKREWITSNIKHVGKEATKLGKATTILVEKVNLSSTDKNPRF